MGVQEAPQRPSNYEIMRDRMEAEFIIVRPGHNDSEVRPKK